MTMTAFTKAKISVPASGDDRIGRRRLLDTLSLSVLGRITPLCAPAGYGKTTLLAEWAGESGCPVAWMTVDEIDNDEIRFWRYAASSVSRHLPSSARERLLALTGSLPSLSIYTFLDALLNELSALPERTVLILDDYHYISNERIHKQLAYWIDYIPEKLHLVVSSRTALPFSAIKWRLRQQATELDAESLRFTREEGAAFFRAALGAEMTKEQLERVLERTEGWATGIQLVSLSLQAGKGFEATMAAFSGEHRDVADFMFHEVLAKLPEDLAKFLMQSSVLAKMDAELCRDVTGRADSARMLELIRQMNLFLAPLDEQGRWFRYHRLFADFLSKLLKRQDAALWTELNRRASVSMARRELLDEAVHYADAAADYALLQEQLARYIPEAMRCGELLTLLRWFGRFPGEWRLAPQLSLLHAFVCVLTGRIHDAEAILQEIESKLHAEEHAAEREELQSGLLFVRSNLVFSSGQFDQWLAFHREIENRILPENPTYYNFNYNLGEPLVRRTAMGMKGVLSPETEAVGTLFAGVLDSHGWERSLINLYVKQSLAEGYYEWNRLDECDRLLRASETAVGGRHVPGLTIPHRLTDSLRYMALGKPDLAYQALDEAWTCVLALPDADKPGWSRQLHAFKLRLLLREGKTAAARQEARQLSVSAKDNPALDREYEYMSLIRLLGKQRKEREALRLLELLKPQAQREGLCSSLTEAAILQALLEYGLGHLEAALSSLQAALELGNRNGYIRSFADEGMPMLELLKRYRGSGGQGSVPAEYVDALVEACRTAADGAMDAASRSSRKPAQLAERLTRSELELLRQLQLGLSNKEIAAALALSEGTIKVYLSQLYGKLGVSSRTQALLAAREMDLLE